MHNGQHQAPAHPYALYPQNVSSDGDLSDSTVPIPVGFAGLGNRRLGAERDEEDIIGPHGHVEQLPAYTRFDESGGKIVGGLVVPAAGGPLPRNGQVPQSMTDSSNLATGQSVSPAPMELDPTEVSWRDMSWSQWWNLSWRDKRKERFCGISFGIILIAAAAIAVIFVVCGGVIGGFMKKHAHNRNLSQAQP